MCGAPEGALLRYPPFFLTNISLGCKGFPSIKLSMLIWPLMNYREKSFITLALGNT
jgi:hypothetical protein